MIGSQKSPVSDWWTDFDNQKVKINDLLIGRSSTAAADWTLEDGVLLALHRPPEEAPATDAHVGPIIVVLSGWTSAHLATGGWLFLSGHDQLHNTVYFKLAAADILLHSKTSFFFFVQEPVVLFV